MSNLVQVLQNAGFRGKGLQQAWAIAMRESGGNPQAFNGNTSTGDKSFGLFQINMLGGLGPARMQQYGLSNEKALFDPTVNARVAYQMSKGGKDFGAWGIGPNAYKGAPPAAYQRYQQLLGQFPGARGSSPMVGGGSKMASSPSMAAPTSGGNGTAEAVAAQMLQQAQALAQPGAASGQAPQANVLSDPSSLLSMAMMSRSAQNVPQTSVTPSPGGKLMVANMSGSPEEVKAVKLAEHYLGTPYVYGGDKPGGFDCSGLLQYVWAQNGVHIPRTTYDQWGSGKAVNLKNLQPGDAVFFKGSDSISRGGQVLPGHVAMYIGNGKVIQAPHTGADVQITPLSAMGPAMGARSFTG
jgi:cell wall-associated NlpC family hydrolase